MKTIFKTIGCTVAEVKELLEKMEANDLDQELLAGCSEAEIVKYLGLTVGKAKKLKQALKANEPAKELPILPTEFNSFNVVVTGNTSVNASVVNDFLNFGMLYSLGAETIGKKLLDLINRRSDETDEPNTEEISKITAVVAKFNNVDGTIAHLLGTDIGFLQDRHAVFNDIKSNMLPTLLHFFNEALQFRLNLASIDNLILSRLSTQKLGDTIDANTINIAAQDLVVQVNKSLKGNNYFVVKSAIKLYNELFELLEDENLLKFLGCRDTRDLLQKCSVSYTPKDVAVLKQLPLIVYQILHILENDLVNDSKILIEYLQTVWSNARTLDWTKLMILGNNSVKPTITVKQKTAAVTENLAAILTEI